MLTASQRIRTIRRSTAGLTAPRPSSGTTRYKERIVVSIFLAVIFVVAGCGASDVDLEKNRKIWNGSHIRSYNFKVVKCGGALSDLPPVLIQVRDGEAVSFEPANGSLDLSDMKGYSNFATIEKCFLHIQESYSAGNDVKVTYNAEFGYPEHVWVKAKLGVDAFHSLDISEFTVVKD